MTKRGSDSLCGAQTAGFSIQVQNPAPQGEKLPIDQDDHETGEFAVWAHHRGVCIDGRMYQAGIICIPPTNFTSAKISTETYTASNNRRHINWKRMTHQNRWLRRAPTIQEFVSKAAVASFTPVWHPWLHSFTTARMPPMRLLP